MAFDWLVSVLSYNQNEIWKFLLHNKDLNADLHVP